MKNALKLTSLASFVGAFLAQGEWMPIVDLDSYSTGMTETELAENGWIFQDGDYGGDTACYSPDNPSGTYDCSALRTSVSTPYDADFGHDTSFVLRASDPDSEYVANFRSSTTILFPEEIPVNGKATVYLRFAMEEAGSYYAIGVSDIVPEATEVFPVDVSWGELGLIFGPDANDFEFEAYEGGYRTAAFQEDGTTPVPLDLQTWYEVWFQVDNQDDTGDGLGSRTDIWIKGGEFTELTHLTNTHPDFVAANFTAWTFRRNAGLMTPPEPVRSLIFVSAGGQTGNNVTSGAIFLNALWMNTETFTTERPPIDGKTPIEEAMEFFGVTENSNGWMVTDLGWVEGHAFSWVYSYDLNTWLYANASGGASAESGAWYYNLGMGAWMFTTAQVYPWAYIAGDDWTVLEFAN
jgi:hypothetical protein